MRRPVSARRSEPIPRYGLYGESNEFEPLDPIHIETIRSRSGSNDWIILPHRHADLHQLMLITDGGGAFLVEGRQVKVRGPRLLSIPPANVHGFHWDGECDGYVLMVSNPLMRSTPQALAALRAPVEMAPLAADEIEAAFAALLALFHGRQPGRALAMTGYVHIILAAYLGALAQAEDHLPVGPAADLVTRYQALLDETYAQQLAVADYCERLSVLPTRLTRACAVVTGMSPLSLAQQRRMLEARRLLIYTGMSVSEISYALGFSEPAYFSRVFSRLEGASPDRWRKARGGGDGTSAPSPRRS